MTSQQFDRFARLAVIACIALAALIVSLHSVAIPYALWQGDEYDYFHNLRTQGPAFFWQRLLLWSPRPLSETAIALYGLAVAHWNRPLIGWALGIVWSLCAILAFGPALLGKGQPFARLFLVAFAAMLVFLGHPVADLHYWPMAAVAHLPVVAAATGLSLTLIVGKSTPRLEALYLSIAAASSEAGVFLAGSYLVLRGIGVTARRESPRDWAWLSLPAILGAIIVWRLMMGRAGMPHPHDTPTQGNALASLRAAIRPFIHNLLMLQPDEISAGGTTGGSVRDGVLLKLLIAVGAAALCRATGWRPRLSRLACLVAALMATSFLTIAAADYEFGFLCCQRHETLRLDFSELIALLLGAGAVRFFPSGRDRALMIACAAMTLFTAETMRWRWPGLHLFLASRALEADARQKTWLSGRSAGPLMTMSQGTNSSLFYYWPWEPGDYKAGGPGWDVQSMMKFFGKQEVIVRPAMPVSIPTRVH
ncbi:hypothetical protein [Brytella acorum]|uniref:Transmembrane protein n=1 Tax=Brytella acorum TaxID=2959299 RepID=A0AA35UUS0_9PROT|nr:hypothetical protein [Brytella acorum]MDF3624349.1 hypothetical protein [Brytella acorum]CAI9119801.1 hypothetical protein LMG32879_000626 [Brytella acorum]